MIPHVGVRVYGTEYFYSDCIESRPVAVMAEMLESFPQVTFDLGPPTMTEAEVAAWVASDELNAQWQPEDYNVFDKNCNHFARLMGNAVSKDGLPDELMQPVIDVTEKMLSELPEWRRSLGLTLMNQRGSPASLFRCFLRDSSSLAGSRASSSSPGAAPRERRRRNSRRRQRSRQQQRRSNDFAQVRAQVTPRQLAGVLRSLRA